MFQSIVVPLDGSPLAAQALDCATQIASPDGHFTLVAVVDIPMDDAFRTRHEQAVAEMLAQSHDALTHEIEARAETMRARGFNVTTTVRVGDAAGEIIRCAADTGADLIAIASRGSGGIAHWLIGSVTNRVLRAATTPLLVVHTQGFNHQPAADRIVVTLDGSPLAETALPVATALATRLGLPLHLVRVVHSQSVIGHTTLVTDVAMLQHLAAYERSAADKYLQATLDVLAGTAVDVSATVLVGNPAEEIVDYLALRPHALVVMTTAGGGRTDRKFGSVTEKVVTVAGNPALVLR